MPQPTDAAYTAVALDLLGRSVRFGSATRLLVNGTSMLPLLRPGDAVWLEAIDPALLRPGDLIAIRQQDVLLTHRLIAVAPSRWQTKGDNNRLADPPVGAEAIQGRIVMLERGRRLIFLNGGGWPLAQRLLGRIGRLRDRLARAVRLQRPPSRALASIEDMPFRLLMRTIVAVALRF
jgi:hypothetical protein